MKQFSKRTKIISLTTIVSVVVIIVGVMIYRIGYVSDRADAYIFATEIYADSLANAKTDKDVAKLLDTQPQLEVMRFSTLNGSYQKAKKYQASLRAITSYMVDLRDARIEGFGDDYVYNLKLNSAYSTYTQMRLKAFNAHDSKLTDALGDVGEGLAKTRDTKTYKREVLQLYDGYQAALDSYTKNAKAVITDTPTVYETELLSSIDSTKKTLQKLQDTIKKADDSIVANTTNVSAYNIATDNLMDNAYYIYYSLGQLDGNSRLTNVAADARRVLDKSDQAASAEIAGTFAMARIRLSLAPVLFPTTYTDKNFDTKVSLLRAIRNDIESRSRSIISQEYAASLASTMKSIETTINLYSYSQSQGNDATFLDKFAKAVTYDTKYFLSNGGSYDIKKLDDAQIQRNEEVQCKTLQAQVDRLKALTVNSYIKDEYEIVLSQSKESVSSCYDDLKPNSSGESRRDKIRAQLDISIPAVGKKLDDLKAKNDYARRTFEAL